MSNSFGRFHEFIEPNNGQEHGITSREDTKINLQPRIGKDLANKEN